MHETVADLPQTPLRAALDIVSGRTWLALLGICLAVMGSGIGESVSKSALADIAGAIGLGVDAASWLTTCYISGFVLGAGFTPCFWPTFSLRRMAIAMTSLYIISGILTPLLAGHYPALLVMRSLQGLGGGAMPPMLMTIVLRFMPPFIKVPILSLYGLVSAWSATTGIPVAALVFPAGWLACFWWNLPLMLLALGCLACGLPQDPYRMERLKQFDWRGLLTGAPALVLLTIALSQGEHYGWLSSPLIGNLLAIGGGLLLLFLLNEWLHPLPFFNLQLLKMRNLAFSLIVLGGVLVVMVAMVAIPSAFLASVQGYRQEQTATLMLWVALPQLITLPLVAVLCNSLRVDSRWVLAGSLVLLTLSALLGAQVTPEWNRDNFYLVQLLQALAQPMAIIPLLMMATGGLQPTDGPFAAAWFNAVKGFAATLATGLLAWLTRSRGDFHLAMLDSPSLTVGGEWHLQAQVLTSADLYRCVALLCVALLLLIPVMPVRLYAPRPV